MNKVVKNFVSVFRKREEIRQADLARAVGVTRQTIIALEKGNYTPSVQLALEIANFFNKKVEDLFILK